MRYLAIIDGADMIFVTAGMWRRNREGTGSHHNAKTTRDMGILTVEAS